MAFVLYRAGLHGGWYGDDLMYLRPPGSGSPWLAANAQTGWYRPLEAAWLAFARSHWDTATWPIHAMAIASHALFAGLAGLALARLGASLTAAAIGAIVVLASQAAAMAVLGNDTLSQLWCALFGSAATLAAWEARGPRRRSFTVLAVSLFALALLSKEAALGFLPVLALVAGWPARSHDTSPATHSFAPPGGWLRWAVFVGLLVGVTAAFLLIRNQVGGLSLAGSRYRPALGLSTLTHVAQLLAAAITPTSSVRTYLAWSSHDRAGLAFAVGAGLVWLAFLSMSMIAGRFRARAAGVALAMLVALGPYALLSHVSELYAYVLLGFLGVIAGLAFESASRAGAAPRLGATLLVAGWLALQLPAVAEKIAFAVRNGAQVAPLEAAARPHLVLAPRDAGVWLVDDDDRSPRYSVFLMPGLGPLNFGEAWLEREVGREDLRVRVVEGRFEDVVARHPQDVVLRWNGREFERALP